LRKGIFSREIAGLLDDFPPVPSLLTGGGNTVRLQGNRFILDRINLHFPTLSSMIQGRPEPPLKAKARIV
jgi:hypothetical protein